MTSDTRCRNSQPRWELRGRVVEEGLREAGPLLNALGPLADALVSFGPEPAHVHHRLNAGIDRCGGTDCSRAARRRDSSTGMSGHSGVYSGREPPAPGFMLCTTTRTLKCSPEQGFPQSSDPSTSMNTPELPEWSRAVVKVGSALVAPDDQGCRTTHLLPIARFITESRRQGKEVLLVSSGAVAAGLAEEGRSGPGTGLSIPERQALAALGQPLLMAHWRRLFDVSCAQVLLTYDDLQRRSRFVNAKNTIAELLDRGTLPIVNENDTVATEELQVGDNDNLAAYVAGVAEADLLVICSDVDGLYTADPHDDPDAEHLPEVEAITDEVYDMVGPSHRAVATGGMQTKVEAAEKATDRGIDTVLVNGTKGHHLDALGRGEMPGTLFRRAERPLSARKHWVLHALPTAGRIVVDQGAADALRHEGASLLPSGIVALEGRFVRGDAVEVVRRGDGSARVAKGITQYGAADLERIQGRQSHAIAEVLGGAPADYVIHRDDLVLVEE